MIFLDIAPACSYEKGLQCNFPKKSEKPKFILPVKISYCNSSLFVSAVSWVEMGNMQRSEQGHFLIFAASPLDFVLTDIYTCTCAPI